MSDGTFTRSRSFEPRMPESRAADQPSADRPGADPLLELARLIGQSDPYAPAQGSDQLRGRQRNDPDPPPPPRVWGRDYPRVHHGPAEQDRYADQQYLDDQRDVRAPPPPPRFPVQSDHPPAPFPSPRAGDGGV